MTELEIKRRKKIDFDIYIDKNKFKNFINFKFQISNFKFENS